MSVQTSSQGQLSIAISIDSISEKQKQRNNFVGGAITRQHFDNMEEHCQMLVYSCLDYRSLSQMALVSRRCANFAKTDDLWRKLYGVDELIKQEPNVLPKDSNSTWKKHFARVKIMRISILNAQREIMEAQRLAERRAAFNRAERIGREMAQLFATFIEGSLLFGFSTLLVERLPTTSELRTTNIAALGFPFVSYSLELAYNYGAMDDCCEGRGICCERTKSIAKHLFFGASAIVIPSYVIYRGLCPYAADTMGPDSHGDLQPGLDMSIANETMKVGLYLLIPAVIRICKVFFPRQMETAFGTFFRSVRVISLGVQARVASCWAHS